MDGKKLTLGINFKGKRHKFRSVYAIRALRREIKKHFRLEPVLDNELNNYFWAEGRQNPPTKVSIVGFIKNNKVYVFLEGSKSIDAFKKANEPKVEKKSKPKAEKKSEKKDSAEKKEKKPKEEKTETKKKSDK